MWPSRIFQSLSLRMPARFSYPTVAPLPESTEFDRWLASELDQLRIIQGHETAEPSFVSSSSYMSCEWVSRAMKVAVGTQKRAVEVIKGACCREEDGGVINGYLDYVIELLDACNGLRERTESTRRYVELVSSILRCLRAEQGPTHAALERARSMLGSLERAWRGWTELDPWNSGFRKIGERMDRSRACRRELEEALHASKSTALFACRTLSVSLSFKSNRRVVGTQGSQLGSCSTSLDELQNEVKAEVEKRRTGGGPLLNELRPVASAAQTLRELLLRRLENDDSRRELRSTVETLSRSCHELEQGIKRLEGRVNKLYRSLISVRVALLDILSGY
ncbi:protein BYPASS1-LIKE-like [Aristolochia californica]|uniref:protein BYPASS1-LIKE-like n=1 Tax=Aristolochia californica TaxID=171875 RepID=UPI0035D8EE5D